MNQSNILRNLIVQLECKKHSTHECPRNQDSGTRCAFCEIDFHYLANKPLMLSCNHLICESCNVKDQPFLCNIDGEAGVIADGTFASLIINDNMQALFFSLQSDYEATVKIHESKLFLVYF